MAGPGFEKERGSRGGRDGGCGVELGWWRTTTRDDKRCNARPATKKAYKGQLGRGV